MTLRDLEARMYGLARECRKPKRGRLVAMREELWRDFVRGLATGKTPGTTKSVQQMARLLLQTMHAEVVSDHFRPHNYWENDGRRSHSKVRSFDRATDRDVARHVEQMEAIDDGS